MVFGARGEHEREGEAARRLDCRGDALNCLVRLVEISAPVVVLDRAADRPSLGSASDGVRGALGISAVTVLEIY